MLAALPQTLHGTIAAPVAELHCALPYCHGARSAPDVPATLPDDGLPFSPDPFSIAGVVFLLGFVLGGGFRASNVVN